MTADRQATLFGKLPSHGDFVRRGDPALVRRLDDWLTGEVERLARAKGDALDTILAGLPVWGFVLPAGLAGALGGSHDRVGRVFPLVCCIFGGRGAARDVAAVLVHAMEERLDADSMAAAIAGSGEDGGASDDDVPCWWRIGGEAPRHLAIAGLPVGADFDQLLVEPGGTEPY